mgnify:CR=1 FL=1
MPAGAVPLQYTWPKAVRRLHDGCMTAHQCWLPAQSCARPPAAAQTRGAAPPAPPASAAAAAGTWETGRQTGGDLQVASGSASRGLWQRRGSEDEQVARWSHQPHPPTHPPAAAKRWAALQPVLEPHNLVPAWGAGSVVCVRRRARLRSQSTPCCTLGTRASPVDATEARQTAQRAPDEHEPRRWGASKPHWAHRAGR